MSTRQTTERCALALAVTGIVALGWCYMDVLGDTFWYIAVGNFLAEHGVSVGQDPFTYTAATSRWVPLMPASYLLFAFTERTIGLLGLLVGCSLVLGGAWSWLWLRHTRGTARWLLYPVVLLGIAQQRSDLAARGQLFGDLCFALFLTLVFACTERRAQHCPWLPLAGLPLGTCWVNLHPSSLLGLGLPPLLAIAIVFERGVDRPILRRLLGLWAALLVGSIVTPFGPELVLEHASLALAASTRSIDLFRSPSFVNIEVLVILLFSVLVLGAVSSNRRELAVERVLLLVLLLAALTGRRYLPLLLMAAVAVAGERLRVNEALLQRFRPALQNAVVTVAVTITVLGLLTPKDPLAHVPAESARYVASRPGGERTFAPYHWGGYFDYVLGPTSRVFIDGRNQLFDDSRVFEDHATIVALRPGWDALLDIYGVSLVVADRGSPLAWAMAQHPAWHQTFEDRLSRVFLRAR